MLLKNEAPDALTVFEIGCPALRLMDPVLASYINDVAYGSPASEDICLALDNLLYRLRYWRISVSLPKSSFGKRSIEHLLHNIDRGGINATPKILNKLESMPFLTTLKGFSLS